MIDVPPLRYADHLFHERTVTSTTANTRALDDRAADRLTGAAVLAVAVPGRAERGPVPGFLGPKALPVGLRDP